jgi:hypothetical protein
MAIETPNRTRTLSTSLTSSRANPSDFVLCEDFVFRPATVDGFSHQTYEDGSAVTMVNFKSYTQSIRDPERRLFDFLISRLQPTTPDESH